MRRWLIIDVLIHQDHTNLKAGRTRSCAEKLAARSMGMSIILFSHLSSSPSPVQLRLGEESMRPSKICAGLRMSKEEAGVAHTEECHI